MWVVSTTLGSLAVLGPGCSTELRTEHQQGFIQQTTLLKIVDQRCNWLVDPPGVFGMRGNVPVRGISIVCAGTNRVDHFNNFYAPLN